MLILKMPALEPMHGYGISVRIEQMSKGVFKMNAGSLSSVPLNLITRLSTP
jgi:PadR family transcriptional regulator, regulatory protein PadR